jgi:uncharacterized protein (TIGR01319 family)
LRGIPEPFAKRTVEGDLGVRSGALGVLDAWIDAEHGTDRPPFERAPGLLEHATYAAENGRFLPAGVDALRLDLDLASYCVWAAARRHAGKLDFVPTSDGGHLAIQTGKDLRDVTAVIGTGGVLTTANQPRADRIAVVAHVGSDHRDPRRLVPTDPSPLIDEDYVMFAVGLLAKGVPETGVALARRSLS